MVNIKEINIKNWTYYVFIWSILKTLLKLIKNDTKTLVFTTLDTSQLKKLMIMKIFIV